MEIQWRLLPAAFVCDGGAFTLAGWLEPAASAGGEACDCVASSDWLMTSLTGGVGHDVTAALLATLTVHTVRNARRSGASLVERARPPTRRDRPPGVTAHQACPLTRRARTRGGRRVRRLHPRRDRPDHRSGRLRTGVGDARRETCRGSDRHRRSPWRTAAPPRRGDHRRARGALRSASGRGRSLIRSDSRCQATALLPMTDSMDRRSAAAFDLWGLLRDAVDRDPRSVAQDLRRAFLGRPAEPSRSTPFSCRSNDTEAPPVAGRTAARTSTSSSLRRCGAGPGGWRESLSS